MRLVIQIDSYRKLSKIKIKLYVALALQRRTHKQLVNELQRVALNKGLNYSNVESRVDITKGKK